TTGGRGPGPIRSHRDQCDAGGSGAKPADRNRAASFEPDAVKALRAFLFSRWFLSFIGTALLALIVWFFGPFLSVFEGWVVRLAIVSARRALWAVLNLVLDMRRARRDAALAQGVTETAPDPTAVASAEEAAALQEKLATALALLKKARGTVGYLYE